ncbi:MAG: hypothetical protein U5R48_12970 [Gammaproteobacteria bacterium]|nr:hypothetical protein [Gammaproteobacteria bacterium]
MSRALALWRSTPPTTTSCKLRATTTSPGRWRRSTAGTWSSAGPLVLVARLQRPGGARATQIFVYTRDHAIPVRRSWSRPWTSCGLTVQDARIHTSANGDLCLDTYMVLDQDGGRSPTSRPCIRRIREMLPSALLAR